MNIKSKLIEILNTKYIEVEDEKIDEYSDNLKLIEDLNFDSIKLVEFIGAIENEFNIEIEDDYMSVDFINNLGNIRQYLEERIKNDRLE